MADQAEGDQKKEKLSSRVCSNCRERHLKCDNDRPCGRCRRSGDECFRPVSKLKFRHGSSAKYESKFRKNQIWLRTSGRAGSLRYVDETKELEAYYAQDRDTSTESDDFEPESTIDHRVFHSSPSNSRPPGDSSDLYTESLNSPTPQVEASGSNDVFASPNKRRKNFVDDMVEQPRLDRPSSSGQVHDMRSLPNQSPGYSFLDRSSPIGPVRRRSSISGFPSNFDHGILLSLNHFSPDTGDTLGSADLSYNAYSTPAGLDGIPENPASSIATSNVPVQLAANTSLLEAVLMRYFVEVLAPWFDLCDPERHFALIIPQRARVCPPLRNAIFTASARHLTRLERYRRPVGVQWNEHYLPELTTETMIHYHNECISNLIQLSMDPDQMHNDNLLAAASILRFHEEIDAPFCVDKSTEGDMFLKVINIFVNAQAPSTPALPHSFNLRITNHDSPETTTSDDTPKPRIVRTDGLRQAAFWVTFRQSVYDSFMKQRPISFPLERCIAFRTYDPAEDAVWADRLVIFCADVLQFCHGMEQSSMERWDELSAQERKWSAVLPPSFQPMYYRPADASKQEVFPEIWYLSDCHVTGIQHVELARILLAVYNPRMPKLGPGYLAAVREMSSNLRNIVLRLCAIARGNRRTPPGLVTACMGIAMCGEHFTQRNEQEALVSVLEELDGEHAWPTESTKQALKKSWGWT